MFIDTDKYIDWIINLYIDMYVKKKSKKYFANNKYKTIIKTVLNKI